MPRKYVDTSGVLKLYVPEPDSLRFQFEVTDAYPLVISSLTLLEFRSAIYGKVRQRLLSREDASRAIQRFEDSLDLYTVLPISVAVQSRASTLLDRFGISHNLRPADAIQLATALEDHDQHIIDVFVCADRGLAQIALTCGLTIAP